MSRRRNRDSAYITLSREEHASLLNSSSKLDKIKELFDDLEQAWASSLEYLEEDLNLDQYTLLDISEPVDASLELLKKILYPPKFNKPEKPNYKTKRKFKYSFVNNKIVKNTFQKAKVVFHIISEERC